ncbi:MAG: glycoside hydrolase family 28 protein [Kiritimatiellia bacterium]
MRALIPATCLLAGSLFASDAVVTRHGATGDGRTLETAAIQAAIDHVAATGGGRVTVPQGTFRTGTIYLKSHVELHLAQGARLVGSGNLGDYNPTNAFPQNFGSVKEGWSARHLILALEQEDVAITGEGVIDGNGRAFFGGRPRHTGRISWRDGGFGAKDHDRQGRPGQMIEFVECRDVRVRDIRIEDAPCWSCFFYGCENVSVRGLRVENGVRNLNTDGLDIDSCRNVTVSDCIIRTGDDAIAIRGSPGRLKNPARVCENITIDNCVFHVSADGMRIGVGQGVIRHVRVSNIVIEHAGRGFDIQPIFSSGHTGVDISDVSIAHCSIRGAAKAISVGGAKTKRVRNILFSDILFEENDIVDERMIDVAYGDGVVLRGVRTYRGTGASRPIARADIAATDAAVEIAP